MRFSLLFALLLAVASSVDAQGARSLYNQDELAELLYANRMELDAIPHVSYRYYVLEDRKINPGENPNGNSVDARAYLYQDAGDGDTELGREKLNGMVAFLNGVFIQDLAVGDTIVLPSEIDLDPRAYSPFPRHYAGGRDFDKLFVIDREVQAWAGYENGDLARWGLVSTGADESETPTGRYNFNWKERYRESTLAPPGETWVMRWVFNFLDERGIHIHQYYALPTTGAASHGCVRLMTADAKWIYEWADGWVTSNGGAARGLASRGVVREQGTTVLVIGDQPDGAPKRFEHTPDGPRLVRVEMPDHPFDVPPGTEQQVRFDRKRQLEAARREAAASAR